MCKQYFEGDTCPASIYGHEFYPERADNGETVWVCRKCKATRGFCSHEVESDSFDYYSHGTGCPETVVYYFCTHCFEALEKPEPHLLPADPILDDPACPDPITQSKQYREYLRTFEMTGIDTARN